MTTFDTPEKKTSENTVKKGENAGNCHFVLIPLFLSSKKRNLMF